MPRFKNVNGIRMQFTPEEETRADQDTIEETANRQARAEAEAVKEANRTSAKAKLKELGLDDDELKQILGI